MVLVAGMTLPMQAQNPYYEDVIYLKNGSIIRGVIIEQIPNVSLKIQTREDNIFVYKMDEIEKITKELPPHKVKTQSRSPKQTNDYPLFSRPKGYLGLFELEGGVGVGHWSADRLNVSFINGYRVIPQFAFGIGIGTRGFFYQYGYATNYALNIGFGFPIFLHLRSDFLATKVSPYIAFNIGYSLPIEPDFFGEGILIEPSLGMGFNIASNNRMNIGLVFPINRVRYRFYDGYNDYYGRGMGCAINLKIGFSL